MHDVLHYFQLQCEAQGLLADEHVAVAGGGVGGHDYALRQWHSLTARLSKERL